MPVIDGAMQDYGLTVDKFLAHAAKWFRKTEVVTAASDGSTVRAGYAELHANARRVSSALLRLGIRQGDYVATLAWNSQEHMQAWYGIMGMGAVCHTLNPRLTAEQLAWMVGQSEARILIASADLAGLAGEILSLCGPASPKLILVDGEATRTAPALADLMREAGDTAKWGEFDETLPCGLCFTSGTTGSPKGVTYTHRANYLHTLRLLQADVFALKATDVVLPVVPMFHANAWGLPFACPATGAKLVLPGRNADGSSLARLINAERVNIAVGVPTVWQSLFDYLDSDGGKCPSLERIIVGGSPISQALMARIEAKGIEVQTTWGMTELAPLGTATPPRSDERSPVVSGIPAVGIDLQLTDAEGNKLDEQQGVEGHLWVRGSNVVERYFGEESRATVQGWFETGDLARIDEHGRLQITGRSKDLIKSGGEWINPAEIEAIVSSHPAVTYSAVVGRADPKWGERPLLLIELLNEEDVSDEELLATLQGKVASWWIPKEIIRLEQMPLAPTGKIDKLRLRSEFCGA